jgi:hypothetical protein
MILVTKILPRRSKFEPLTPKNSAVLNWNRNKIKVQKTERQTCQRAPRSGHWIHEIFIKVTPVFLENLWTAILAPYNTVSTSDSVFATWQSVISGFCCEVDEKCALLGHYAASSGNCLPTFRDILLVLSAKTNLPGLQYLTPKDRNDRLSWNVGKEISLLVT